MTAPASGDRRIFVAVTPDGTAVAAKGALRNYCWGSWVHLPGERPRVVSFHTSRRRAERFDGATPALREHYRQAPHGVVATTTIPMIAATDCAQAIPALAGEYGWEVSASTRQHAVMHQGGRRIVVDWSTTGAIAGAWLTCPSAVVAEAAQDRFELIAWIVGFGDCTEAKPLGRQ